MRKRDNVMALISAFCFGAIFTAFILAIARYGSNWPSVTFLWDIAQFRITRIAQAALGVLAGIYAVRGRLRLAASFMVGYFIFEGFRAITVALTYWP